MFLLQERFLLAGRSCCHSGGTRCRTWIGILVYVFVLVFESVLFLYYYTSQCRIHPPDVIGKYAPDSVIGMIGGGGGGAVAGGAPAAGGGAPGIPMTEVAKHSSKTDCWVVVDGQVLDVTSFLSEHPGGELAILTFAGKDATEEFNMSLVVS